MLTAKLGLGPMSIEIIEAIFRCSEAWQEQLMLISSKNQVDYNDGYVLDTDLYVSYIKELRKIYPGADVKLCRDHCGPGFKTDDQNTLEDTKKTIREDIKHGFDLIHLDLCHLEASHEEKLHDTAELINFCREQNPNIMIEIGTDENVGNTAPDTKRIIQDIEFFLPICLPEFYVIQTGSLVRENYNSGSFYFNHVLSAFAKQKNIKIKEHNGDYLSFEQIVLRRGVIDAINIAPQLGVAQTQQTLLQALIYGINIQHFLDLVYKMGRWKKWINQENETNKYLCCLIAGHYHFNSHEYQIIIEQLSKEIDIKEIIIETIIQTIDHYICAFDGASDENN